MITLGIDPSLVATGLVFLEKGKVLKETVIKSKPNGKSAQDELERLHGIIAGIDKAAKDAGYVDIVAIEGMAFMARNTRSIVQLAGLNYLIRNFLFNNEFKYVVVQPTSLKKFVTGKGNAPKDTMMLETYKRYKVTYTDNNLCDAYGLARIGEAILSEDIKLTKPQEEVVQLLK